MTGGRWARVVGVVVAAFVVVAAAVAGGVFLGHRSAGRSAVGRPSPTSPGRTDPPATSAAGPPPSGACPPATAANPTFGHVVGGRLLDGAGRPFAPTGVTVFGLAYTKDWQTRVAHDETQITLAAHQWCTNYVRLQLSPVALLSAPTGDAAYMAAIDQEVDTALRLNEDVVLSCQTQHAGNKPLSPDPSIVAFWKVLAPRWSGNHRVAFDLFNEPRGDAHNAQEWPVWQSGGDGYVGMQELATDVRSEAPGNVIIVEGPSGASTLKELPQYPITVPDVVFSVHPYRQDNESTWNANWGNLAGRYPIIVGEWSMYASSRNECSPNAATVVPAFLSYLRQHQIGLGVWALIPGVLITDPTTQAPTRITPTFTCAVPAAQTAALAAAINDSGATGVPGAQGAGQLIQDYFRQE